MNLAITIGRKGDEWEVITDPNTPVSSQRRGFVALCKELTGEYDELQVVTTNTGRIRRRKLRVRSQALGFEPEVEVEEPEADADGEDLI